MKRIISLILTAITAAAIGGCAGKPPAELAEQPGTSTPPKIQLSNVDDAAVTDFAVRLFRESSVNGKNTLISPLSVLTALSMTANGADAETLNQMEAVLGMPIAQLNDWIKGYIESLPMDEKYKLSLANSIWIKDSDSFTVNEGFINTVTESYKAGIYKRVFDKSTLDAINKWVEDNTDGMIKDILDKISANAVMYLVNALAFDAEWQQMYNEYQVSEGVFTDEDGAAHKVDMMYSTEGVYLENDNATGFVKYYKDRKYAFAALLPKEGTTVEQLVNSLDGAELIGMLKNPDYKSVKTATPKFETEYNVEMSEILKTMGMEDAFNENTADFTKIGTSTGRIFISRVIHQTYINVDARGTKAGAATIVEMAMKSAMPIEQPKQVYLDRPFVYMLIDCETNIPFFIGTMMNPEA